MTKGVAAFTKSKQNNSIIGIVDPNNILEMNKNADRLRVI